MSEQPVDPADGQGGMTLESGAEAAGGIGGPNASVGPTPYEQGVTDGRQQQYTADHEALGSEDPIGDVLKAVAGGVHGAVDLGGELLGGLSDMWGSGSQGEEPDAGSDGGDSPDATVEQPDATVTGGDAGAPGEAGAPADDDGGYCADPGYSDQDGGGY